MSLFSNLRLNSPFGAAALEANSARRKADDAAQRVTAAERRADKALLICEALWTLLRERCGLEEHELLDRLHEIDMTDGKLDGKVRRPPANCPACQRRSPARFENCIYCGATLDASPFAR